MQRYAAVITVVCVLLCLTFNYTFPLRRLNTKWSLNSIINRTNMCHANIARTMQLQSNIENSGRKIRNSTLDDIKKARVNMHSADRNTFTEDDLRQYEQLVIMKKYPYLDLKELELSFSPTGKAIRQNVKIDSGLDLAGDSEICDPLEDGSNVEIINRGLTGFAIPAKIAKSSNAVETKTKTAKDIDDNTKAFVTFMKHADDDVLGGLRDDIREYEEKKLNKNKSKFI